MRKWRLFLITIISFIAILGENWVKKIIPISLCILLNSNSAACYINFNDGRVEAAIANINLTDNSSNQILTFNQDLPTKQENDFQHKLPSQIAVPPIIRPAETNLYLQNALPKDFRISSQIPYSSGKQEILLVSPSTGAEQLYTFNVPGSRSFQLFEVEYKKVSAIDFSSLTNTDSLIVNPEQIKSGLNRFKITFANNSLSKITLLDGTTANFSPGQAIIKSPQGQTMETVKISQNEFIDQNILLSQERSKMNKNLENNTTNKNAKLLAKTSELACQAAVSSSLNGISDSLGLWGNKLTTSKSLTTKSVGWAISFGSGAIKSNISTKNPMLQEVNCRPPVQCEEQNVSGGSEIRTDLFQVAKGANRKVNLKFEFYVIPDRIELYFDGKQIFGLGPKSGPGNETFDLPTNAEYVGVKLIGNDDVNTRWEYVISCSGSVIADKPYVDLPSSGVVIGNESLIPPCIGRLTFEAEGQECPEKEKKCHRYHSRKPHVPDNNSGVTIGRGYDLKRRTPDKIRRDLINAGLRLEDANIYAKAGCNINPKTKQCEPQYLGKKAQDFIDQNELIEITWEQQKKIFEITYSELENDVKRISTNEEDKWGGDVNWENLDPKIKEVVIDLRFRGDYTPQSRNLIQKHLIKNDFNSFLEAMKNENFWLTQKYAPSKDRIKRRIQYLQKDIDKDCNSSSQTIK